MLIAISGYAGSGKDLTAKAIQYLTSSWSKQITFEDYLQKNICKSGWKVKRFAGKLKECASLLTGIPVEDFEKQEVKNSYLPSMWDIITCNHSKSYAELCISKDCSNCSEATTKQMLVRELLQRLGTEAVRDGLHQNAWVNAFFAGLKVSENIIVADLRFPNEYQAVLDRGGVVIRVNRTERCFTPKHSSETALDNFKFDYVIQNDGTYQDLCDSVKEMLKYFELL